MSDPTNMKIANIPTEFKSFFNRFRDLLSNRQFFYLSAYVYSLILLLKEKKNVTPIAASYIENIY